jgi:hypothetical protein
MERESFENQAIADLMNRYFVNIKVDREERPDLDEIYMQATTAMNQGHGGWPMTVFLTPDQEPIFAGTYFPPTDRYGRPGFGLRIKPTLCNKPVDSPDGYEPPCNRPLRLPWVQPRSKMPSSNLLEILMRATGDSGVRPNSHLPQASPSSCANIIGVERKKSLPW